MDTEIVAKPSFFRRKSTKIGIGIVAVLAIAGYFLSPGEEQEYVVAEAVKGDIVQTVDVTGSIKADPTLDLHFQKTGTVKEILVEEGELVSEDKLLASLVNEALELDTSSKEANLNYAYALFNQTKSGAKYEEILIAQADVKSAQASLDAANVELENTYQLSSENINSAELTLEQAQDSEETALNEFNNTKELAEKEIQNLETTGGTTQAIALDNAYAAALTQLDSVITIIQDSMQLAETTIGVRGSGYAFLTDVIKNQLILFYHRPADTAYDAAIEAYEALGNDPTNDELDFTISATLTAANSILELLTKIGIELQELSLNRTDLDNLILEITNKASALTTPMLSLQDNKATIDTINTGSVQDIETLKLSYQIQIDNAESKYNAAVKAVKEAENNLEKAKLNAEIANNNAVASSTLRDAALDTANAMLSLKRSPARDVDLAPLLAQITQAEISLQIAQNNLEESQLLSPIAGIVTFIYGEVGENISLTETSLTPFLSIQADQLIVEANVPETDVVKVEVGDAVKMTIDAFEFTEQFEGSVAYVDRAETVIQGVIYYGLKTTFDVEDERLKSGMTVNLEIETDKKMGVLMIPIRALKFDNGSRYVEILRNGQPERIDITTGLESDQFVEVLSGLNEGDKIITFVK